MSVRVATSNQSQALTRSLAGSTAAPRQDPGDASFDGVLSNVADDHASGAQPSGTMPDKDAAGAKTPPNGTPAFPTDATAAATAARDASSAATASASVLSLASLAGDAAAAWTGSTGTSTSSAKVKMNHADAAKAGPGDSGPSPTSTDPSATPAGLSPQLSLLALVQSAAALPSSDPSAGPASDTASSNATVAATQVLSNGTPPLSGDQKGASAGPLISDVTFQTYLAPVSTAVAPSVPPALPQAATPDTTPLLADAKPQSDVSTNVALGALIAPLAQAAVGKQAVGSFDTAVGPSSTDSSSGGKAAIAQIGAVASLFQDLGNVLPLRGGIPASSPVQTDTPTPDSAPTNAAIPTGPAQFSAGGSDAVSVPPVSAPSVSDPLVSAAPVAVPLVSAPSVSDPLVSAAPVAAIPPGIGPSCFRSPGLGCASCGSSGFGCLDVGSAGAGFFGPDFTGCLAIGRHDATRLYRHGSSVGSPNPGFRGVGCLACGPSRGGAASFGSPGFGSPRRGIRRPGRIERASLGSISPDGIRPFGADAFRRGTRDRRPGHGAHDRRHDRDAHRGGASGASPAGGRCNHEPRRPIRRTPASLDGSIIASLARAHDAAPAQSR